MAAEGMDDLPRVGNVLCLDLVNLVEPRVGEVDRDHLRSFADVVSWAAGSDVIDDDEARRLRDFEQAHPRQARSVFERTVELREALHRTFAALVAGRHAPPDDLLLLVQANAMFTARAVLERQGDVFVWNWRGAGRGSTVPSFERREDAEVVLLGEVVSSAIDLLRSGPLDRLKACPIDEGGCAWLFLDTSKNRSRRWCSMNDCGARVKSQRHYAKRRGSR